MARKHPRPAATQQDILAPLCTQCAGCGQTMWVAYHTQRTITTLQGICHLTLCVRRCRNQQCPRYHCPYRPEEEGRWALPHGEFGLDVIALVGMLRYTSHRSIPAHPSGPLWPNSSLEKRSLVQPHIKVDRCYHLKERILSRLNRSW